jgi:hypothetical protein
VALALLFESAMKLAICRASWESISSAMTMSPTQKCGPVYQFDATDAAPGLVHYWGYDPISFFAPYL